jgi:AraC-like DNA-binding protein
MNIGLNLNLISTFDRYLYRELISGVQQRGWRIDHQHGLLFPSEALASSGLDAYVTWVQNEAEYKQLCACPVTVINFTYLLPTPALYQVTHDQWKIGSMAAKHLQDLGHPTAACLGSGTAYSRERMEGFKAEWTQPGQQVRMYRAGDPGTLPEILQGIMREKGNRALFCTTDELAMFSIQFFEQNGVRVPTDIAVVGVGHEEIHGLCLGREISSIVTDYRKLAARVLEVLERIHANPLTPKTLERIPPLEVFAGETCCPVLPDHPGLRRAMELLMGDTLQDVDLDRLARAAGMSRRNFERTFKQHRRVSPGAAIRQAKISLAKRMLRNHRFTIETVAERCGYADRNHFSIRFKKDTGYSPAQYRGKIKQL